MCVICVKKKGVRMPNQSEITAMWARNPDGAGFMFARNGKLTIRKGFMDLNSLMQALADANIQESEPLVLHFRISTQAGITPQMTHPFPVSAYYSELEKLESCPQIGFAHNGIIARTSGKNARYSDTALFVAKYVNELLRQPCDVSKRALLEAIGALAPNNRFAVMNRYGKIATIGEFRERDGLLYSNLNHIGNYSWLCKKF